MRLTRRQLRRIIREAFNTSADNDNKVPEPDMKTAITFKLSAKGQEVSKITSPDHVRVFRPGSPNEKEVLARPDYHNVNQFAYAAGDDNIILPLFIRGVKTSEDKLKRAAKSDKHQAGFNRIMNILKQARADLDG